MVKEKPTTMSVLELIGWVALGVVFISDYNRWWRHEGLGLASLFGFVGMLIGDLRFSVLFGCLLVLSARRHRRSFPKEPTLKVQEIPAKREIE